MSVKLLIGTTRGKPVRFSYVNVFKARLNTQNNKTEYSVTVLIPKANTEDITKIREAIASELKQEFTAKGKPIPPLAWNPLRDGDTDKKQNGELMGAECRGHYVINLKKEEAQGAPGIVDSNVQKILDPKEFSSGDWGAASFNLVAYGKGTGGVGSYLINLQKLKNGEPMSSGNSRAEDDFTAVEEDFLS